MALAVGKEIHDVMIAGMNAYVWWYIVRFYGPISDGTNDSGKKGEVTKRGYIMSQYSRFIRPGYHRIECNSYPQSSIYVSAYKDSSSSKVVVVALNYGIRDKDQTFTFQNGHVEMLTPYVTSETRNCERENEIPVSDNSFSITLAARSITTFVAGISTSVKENSTSIPAPFKLFQNYPNPFNPSTQISFAVPEKSFVSLKVYNLLGKEITELAGKEYSAGEHTMIFDASQLGSGIYFYTLKTGDFTQTRKMFMIR